MTTKSQYKRERNGIMSILDAQDKAHKIAFYPMTFQAIRCLINFGILSHIINHKDVTKDNIIKAANLSDYAVGLILDIAEMNEIISQKNGKFKATKLGLLLQEDEAIKVNINFMNDVCYQGAFDLDKSFQTGKPEGLKVFGNWETIYQGLGQLDKQTQKSWFDFDNYYSDLVFDEAIQIVLKNNPKVVYDVGGNTAKFDIAILNTDKNVNTKIFDLPPQIKKAQANIKKAGFEDRVEFCPMNILDETSKFPPTPDAIWMSQFLDCFSPDRIVFILQKLKSCMSDETKLYILEPFVDQQNDIAALSLTNISLYFTCMANGYSKMYKQSEMLALIEQAGLRLVKAHQNLGEFDYTLLECQK